MNFIINYDPTTYEIKNLGLNVSVMVFDQSIVVKKIGVYACRGGIVSFVDMSNSQIEIIEDAAFYQCSLLTKVILPNTLKEIHENAFFGTILVDIVIPSSVEKMTAFAWNQIPTIERFDVEGGNNYFSSYEGFLYNKDKTALICAPRKIKTEKDIPFINTIKSINEYALTSTELVSFKCPPNIQSIETRVFHNILEIETIDFTLAKITSLPTEFIFAGCSKLILVKLPYVLETITTKTFNLAQRIETVYLYPYIQTIENNAFNDCPSLKYIIYFGNKNFSMNLIFTGQTDKNALKIYVTNIYLYDTFGTVSVIQRKITFLQTIHNNLHKLCISPFAFMSIFLYK